MRSDGGDTDRLVLQVGGSSVMRRVGGGDRRNDEEQIGGDELCIERRRSTGDETTSACLRVVLLHWPRSACQVTSAQRNATLYKRIT